jgi:hypothetical protein
MMSPSVSLVGGAKIPLSFIGFGLICLLAAAVTNCLQPALLLQPFLHPSVVAYVHLWLPGFLLSVCMGAMYQLMPVVLGVNLRLPLATAWTHLGLHACGIPLLVAAFATGQYQWAALGGGFVATGVLILTTAVYRTFRASKRRDPAAWSFPLAATWLAVTVCMGVVMALNRRFGFLPLSVVSLLRAHAHLGLVGFFLSLLQGTTFQLVPMFTMGTAMRPRFIWAGLIGTQTGLLLLAPGLAWDLPLVAGAGGAIVATGVICTGSALVATLKTRRRKKLEPGIRAYVTGAGIAALATAAGLLRLLVSPGGDLGLSTLVAYGVLCVAGVLTFTVLGMLCKIVPFLVWMRAYGPHVGKRPVPLAPSLGSHRLEISWLCLHATGLAVLILAIFFQSAVVAELGSFVLAAGIFVFLTNILRIGKHLWVKLDVVAPARAAAAPLSTS